MNPEDERLGDTMERFVRNLDTLLASLPWWLRVPARGSIAIARAAAWLTGAR